MFALYPKTKRCPGRTIFLLFSAFAVLISVMVAGARSVRAGSVEIVSVPFVGCKSDGQVGPLKPPKGAAKPIAIDPATAKQLAFYKAEYGIGVLAPRGWFCFGLYGSNGSILIVAAHPLNGNKLLDSPEGGLTGGAIQVSESDGDTSGRFEVARIVARMFPARKAFVDQVIAEGIEPAEDFPSGPYPNDELTVRNANIVEYLTPANSDGFGARSRLKPNADPIQGTIILNDYDGVLSARVLSARLPGTLSSLAPLIIGQLEKDSGEGDAKP